MQRAEPTRRDQEPVIHTKTIGRGIPGRGDRALNRYLFKAFFIEGASDGGGQGGGIADVATGGQGPQLLLGGLRQLQPLDKGEEGFPV